MIVAHVPFDTALASTVKVVINAIMTVNAWQAYTVELLYKLSTDHPIDFIHLCKTEGVTIQFDILAKTAYVQIDTSKKTFITLNQLHKLVPFVTEHKFDYTVSDIEVKNDTGYTFDKQARWEFKKCKVTCNGSNLIFRDGSIVTFDQCSIIGGSILTDRLADMGGQGIFNKCSFESSPVHNNKLLRLSLGANSGGVGVNAISPIHMEQKLEFNDCDFGKTSMRIRMTQECVCEFHHCSFMPFNTSSDHPRFIARYDDLGEVLFMDCTFPPMQAFPSHYDDGDEAMDITGIMKKNGVVINMTPDKFTLDNPHVTDFPRVNVIRQSTLMSTDRRLLMFVEMTPQTVTRTLSNTNFNPDDHKFYMDGFNLNVGYGGDPDGRSLYNLKNWRFGRGLTTVNNAIVNLNAYLPCSDMDIRANGKLLVPDGCPPYCGTELVSDERFLDLVRKDRIEFSPLWHKATPMQCPTVVVKGKKTMDNLYGYKFPAMSTKFQANMMTMEHEGTNWFMHLEMATRIADKESLSDKPTPLNVMYQRFESFVMLSKLARKMVSK